MTPLRGGGPELVSVETPRTERLILFTRYPIPGQAKTRLIPTLGAEGAARLQRRLTLYSVRAADSLQLSRGVRVEIQFDGATGAQMSHWLGDRFEFSQQVTGDLGARLCSAFERSFQQGSQATVVMGSDCPALSPEILEQAFDALRTHPVVLGPANDGGYYLIGLRQPVPQLFSGISWGTSSVLSDSVRILAALELKPVLLGPLDDIDRPEDLSSWHRITETEEVNSTAVSVIIPALNEAQQIRRTIASAVAAKPLEVIVVDGGSWDETAQLARQAGATVLTSTSGRARQMNAGAAKASGHILLFLHADTLLAENCLPVVLKHLRQSRCAAAAFRFAVAESFAGSKLLEWTTNLRSRWLQMPYGDQALSLRRSLFEELGGFPDLPILEDYELVRRLRTEGRVVTLPIPALTSARRWQRLGFWRTTWLNTLIILAYRLGRPASQLASVYSRSHR